MSKKLELKFTWTYDDYLAVTEQWHSEATLAKWVKTVELIDNKYYEGVDSEIKETIEFINDEILKEK